MDSQQARNNIANSVVNVAAYKFVCLDRLAERRESLRTRCRDLQLKGTILLSTEGINLFLAGTRTSIDAILGELESDSAIGRLEKKFSLSDRQPFRRMLVKIKREIIAFGIEGIEPGVKTSRRISPAELKQWLDEGRACTLVDVRNDYEVRLGTFEGAVPIGVDHFRQFPEAVERSLAEHKKGPVVTFCTGGIRCEKAGPFLEQAGFDDVYQLDGGILNYFEQCGGEHYEGECFVFDRRTALDTELRETSTTLCYACQQPLTADQQQSPHYLPGESCPYCYEQKSQAD